MSKAQRGRRGLRKSVRRRYEAALRGAGWTRHETAQGEKWRPSDWDPDRGPSHFLGWGICAAHARLKGETS